MIAGPETGVTSLATPSDTEVVITRVFDAPRALVFDAWTKPEHLQRWCTGYDGWTMPVCEVDHRPGGKWRYVFRSHEGAEMTMQGVCREYTPPSRFVTTESWGPEWPESINTLVFTESGGRTIVTLTITYQSKAIRDAALETGMKDGLDVSLVRLDGLLASLA